MSSTSLHHPVYTHVSELAALKKLAITPTQIKTTHMAQKGIGERKSPFKSKGLDFQEVRVYQPGDDIRQIDWRVTARYGKPFTKLYTDEKARSVILLIDMRSHMKFASSGDFKSVIAARCGALLTFIGLKYKDTIKAVVLMPDIIKSFSGIKTQEDIYALLSTLSDASLPQNSSTDTISLTQGLQTTLQLADKGAAVFILSDFHDITSENTSQIALLAEKRTVTFIHIFDMLEENLPGGYLPITNGSKTIILDMNSPSQRDLFSEQFNQLKTQLTHFSKLYEIGYLALKTSTNYLSKVRAYCL